MNMHRRVETLNDQLFDTLYGRFLVYNACWEDPAVDRQALQLTSSDNVMVSASAGCNALDGIFERIGRIDGRSAVPYVPLLKVPYFVYIKRMSAARARA